MKFPPWTRYIISSNKIFWVFTSLINKFVPQYLGTEILVFVGTKLILARANQISKISGLYAPPHFHIGLIWEPCFWMVEETDVPELTKMAYQPDFKHPHQCFLEQHIYHRCLSKRPSLLLRGSTSQFLTKPPRKRHLVFSFHK